MRMMQVRNAVLLASVIAVGTAVVAPAQSDEMNGYRPMHPTQGNSRAGMGNMMEASEGTMPTGVQCMMMQPGTTGGMPMMGMGGNMMKFMLAIADTDGDGALSLEEVTAIHKRIFNAMDTNKDGKVTPEEMQEFWRP